MPQFLEFSSGNVHDIIFLT